MPSTTISCTFARPSSTESSGAHLCRSWLASEDGFIANIDVNSPGLFAGKPAPTVVLR